MNILLKNIGSNLLLQVLTYAFPIIILPYVTLRIGESAFGAVSYYGMITGCLAVFVMFGFDHTGTKHVARAENLNLQCKIFMEIQVLKWILVCISAFILAAMLSFQWIDNSHPSIAWGSFIATVGIGLQPNWFLQGKMEIQKVVPYHFAFKALAFFGTLLLVKNPNDVWIFVAITGLSVLLPAIFTSWIVMQRFTSIAFELRFREVVHWLEAGKWMFGISVLLYLNQSLVLYIISVEESIEEVGIYSLGWRLMNAVMVLVLGPILNSLFPLSSKYLSHDKSISRKWITQTSWKVLSILVLIIVPFSLGLHFAFPMAFSHDFQESLTIFKILIAVPFFGTVTHIISIQYMVNIGKERKVLIKLLGASLPCWIVSIVLVKWHGIIGGALGSVLLELILMTVFIYQLWSQHGGESMPLGKGRSQN